MTTNKYEYSVFINDFTICTDDHIEHINHLLSISDKVIILISSAFRARSCTQPFSYSERIAMIVNSFNSKQNKLILAPIHNYNYNKQTKLKYILDTISGITQSDNIVVYNTGENVPTGLLYKWDQLSCTKDVPAGEMLHDFFTNSDDLKVSGIVKSFLDEYKKTSMYQIALNEYNIIKDYKDSWSSAPYPPIFVTSDAILVCNGYVLLVVRGDNPGKGLYALPGGFVNQYEDMEEAAYRELIEETQLDIKVGNPTKSGVFAHPTRSARGRVITRAFLYEIDVWPLPNVIGSDDAAQAIWKPINELNPVDFFDDHWDIIFNLLQ